MRRIPVFTDDPGWHGQQLSDAFALRGYETVFMSLRDGHFTLQPGNAGLALPGFENTLPQGAFVRGVSGGTLQQVIARLDILHALNMLGVVVYNNGRAIERTVDKAMTSFLLHLHGVPTPPTWICESREHAQGILLRETMAGHHVVSKPLFGSQGVGVRRLEAGIPLPVPMQEHVDGVYYLQSYVDSGEGAWHDYRVFVINQQVVAAMARHGNQWVNNVAQGGRCEVVQPDQQLAALALAAAKAVDIDYCGVDIIRDRDGKLFVLEVNSIPAWRGLQKVVGVNVAQAVVDDFLGKLNNRRSIPVAV